MEDLGGNTLGEINADDQFSNDSPRRGDTRRRVRKSRQGSCDWAAALARRPLMELRCWYLCFETAAATTPPSDAVPQGVHQLTGASRLSLQGDDAEAVDTGAETGRRSVVAMNSRRRAKSSGCLVASGGPRKSTITTSGAQIKRTPLSEGAGEETVRWVVGDKKGEVCDRGPSIFQIPTPSCVSAKRGVDWRLDLLRDDDRARMHQLLHLIESSRGEPFLPPSSSSLQTSAARIASHPPKTSPTSEVPYSSGCSAPQQVGGQQLKRSPTHVGLSQTRLLAQRPMSAGLTSRSSSAIRPDLPTAPPRPTSSSGPKSRATTKQDIPQQAAAGELLLGRGLFEESRRTSFGKNATRKVGSGNRRGSISVTTSRPSSAAGPRR
eukprot:GHVS01029334.1.p1 GENE.GHVS01029334.1~~GHVS01029334.1.p1  ORF type:complete len:379 (-),score=53.28 GHVS01029334.1:149-1285(-)